MVEIDALIELYKRAMLVKTLYEDLERKKNVLITDAKAMDVLKGDGPPWNLIDFIANLKILLEKELPSLIQSKDYRTVEIIANLFTQSFGQKGEGVRGERVSPSVEMQEQGFETPLRDSLYKESEDFGDLLNPQGSTEAIRVMEN